MPGPAPIVGSVITMVWLGIAWIWIRGWAETAIFPTEDYQVIALIAVVQQVLSWRGIQRAHLHGCQRYILENKNLIHIFDYPSFV